MEISIFNFFSRYVPEEPKIEFVDIDFFPEKKYQLFDEVKPSLEKILNALKEKCAGFNIFFDEEELRTLGMMTGKLIGQNVFRNMSGIVRRLKKSSTEGCYHVKNMH